MCLIGLFLENVIFASQEPDTVFGIAWVLRKYLLNECALRSLRLSDFVLSSLPAVPKISLAESIWHLADLSCFFFFLYFISIVSIWLKEKSWTVLEQILMEHLPCSRHRWGSKILRQCFPCHSLKPRRRKEIGIHKYSQNYIFITNKCICMQLVCPKYYIWGTK